LSVSNELGDKVEQRDILKKKNPLSIGKAGGGEIEWKYTVLLTNHILNSSYKAVSKKECLILKENKA
jgi:hypothetical protein